MNTLGMTQSVCGVCRRMVPAKVAADEAGVHFEKFCPEHGRQRSLVYRGVAGYLAAQRFVKPAWVPRAFAGDSSKPCPDGCGFCDRHEQHLCMPIIEITGRCDLACPVCLVDAGGDSDLAFDAFRRVLDGLLAAEGQVDVLNLSGGEPLLHPQLLDFVDEALSRPEIVRVSISTNGLALLHRPGLVDELAGRNVVVSLQFDGFSDRAYTLLRGRPLWEKKQRILEMLAGRQAPASLTVTLAGGVNDDQLPAILDLFFSQPHLVSMMIQPIAFAGRGAVLADTCGRLTLPDVLRLLDKAGNPRVRAADFAPLPCSHPLCFSLAYYLMLDQGGSVSLNQLVGAARMMDTLANRTVFGLDQQESDTLRDMIYDLWSGSAAVAPDGDAVMRTLRGILDEINAGGPQGAGGGAAPQNTGRTPVPQNTGRMPVPREAGRMGAVPVGPQPTCSCFDPRRAFNIAERRIKSIFIHAFQDAKTFDLARVRRCCNAYPLADGRLMPACVYNVKERNR